MATTEDRLQQTEQLEELEELLRQPSAELDRIRTDSPPAAQGAPRKSKNWSRPLLVAWIATMTVLYIIEPSPTDPAATPLWGTILILAFTYALFASIAGLAARRRWGLAASALSGGLGIAIAAACAATGHHAGSWWIAEGLAFAAIGAASLAALRTRT